MVKFTVTLRMLTALACLAGNGQHHRRRHPEFVVRYGHRRPGIGIGDAAIRILVAEVRLLCDGVKSEIRRLLILRLDSDIIDLVGLRSCYK
jgi:hypothetical protein